MIDGVTDEQRNAGALAIRHVMFDADGVLQDLPGGWIAAAEPFFGERTLEFLERSYEAHLPTLAGQGDHMTILAAILTDFGVTVPVADVYRGIWLGIEPAAASFAIVRALRGRGYGVHLGTNQESYRTAHMREILGYDALFDVCCYSCELGAAKPDVAFFTEAAKRIGADPPTVLFIDDSTRNVEGARAAGFAAERWCLDDGYDALHDLFARHGVSAL
jgi:putative hydrolase of the HAD superfamily